MEFNNTVTLLENKPKSYSVSRLKTYSECSQAYKYKYIDKLKVTSASVSTIIGSLLHESLEIYLHPDNTIDFITVFENQSKIAFYKRKYIDENTDKSIFDKLYNNLLEYSRDVRTLYHRASADYTGKLAIRTKDGKVSNSPMMTSGWKTASKNLNLGERYYELEDEFNQICILEDISLVEAFTEAYNLASNYETPEEIIETVALEFKLSDYNYETKEFTNAVLMPDEYGGDTEIYLNGYIDWLGYVMFEGQRRFALIDYKSSKENLTVDKLEYHAQLLAYVYAVEKLTGIQVEVIGVHSLRHKKLVLVEVDRDILKVANNSLFSKHNLIANNYFYQEHLPDSQYSKCLNSFNKECPFLQYCYPKMYNRLHPESISNQLESLLLN